MPHQPLINLLGKYGTINKQEELNIRKYFDTLNLEKKDILIESNKPCDKLFFVNRGLLRAYYTSIDGKETTRMIAWESRFMTNVVSFRNIAENKETIDCIEKADILHINRNNFDLLMKSSSNLKSIYTDILEEYNALHIRRFEQLNSENTLEKLKYFNENFPALKNRISDTFLASFISISRKTLERIKKNV